MIFNWLNSGSPYFWTFFAALFLGFACARATRPTRWVDKWVLFNLYLSAATAFGLLAVLIPGAAKLKAPELAYFAAAVTVTGFLANRHKLSFGIPAGLLGAILLVLLAVSLSGWVPVASPAAPVARVQVLAVTQRATTLEITPATNETSGAAAAPTVIGALPSGEISARAGILRFNEAYFFFTAPTLCRLIGVGTVTPAGGSPGSATEITLAGSGGVNAPLAALLPGVRYERLTTNATSPVLLTGYVVELHADGTLVLLAPGALTS